MRKLSKTLIAGVLSLSMCVSPIGVMAGEEPIEEVFVEEEDNAYDEVYYEGEGEDNEAIEFDEGVTTEGEEFSFDEPSFVEEDQFVEENVVIEEDVVIEEIADAVPNEAIVDETITEDELIEEYSIADEVITDDDIMTDSTIVSDSEAFGESISLKGSCGSDIKWQLTGSDSNLKLTLSGSGSMNNYSESSAPWASYRDQIKTLVVGEGITNLGQCSFYSCTNLTTVSLPSTLTNIGNSAFREASSLKTIRLPNGLIKIDPYAFMNCSALSSITIPDSVTTVELQTFYGCSSLTSVVLSNNLSYIKSSVFGKCESIQTITLPNSVTSISSSAFSGCKGLRSIKLSGFLLSIGETAFSGCESLKTVEIPNSVYSIGKQAFKNCKSLTYIKLPKSLTTCGTTPFDGCVSLSTIVVPANLPYIGSSLSDTYYDETGKSYTIIPKGLENETKLTRKIYISGITLDIDSYTLPIGGTVRLSPIITPVGATERNVVYSSSDDEVASVSQYGVITGKKKGNVYIYATSAYNSSIKTSCKITVETVNSIDIQEDGKTLYSKYTGIGKTFALKAVITPSIVGDASVEWSSSVPSVASIDAEGVVTTYAAGSTYIKAKSIENPNVTKSIYVTVYTVKKVTIDNKTNNLDVGENLQINTTVDATDYVTDKSLVWTSSNPEVADVTEEGVVTGKKTGSTVIKAASKENPSASDEFTLNVKNNQFLYISNEIDSIDLGASYSFNVKSNPSSKPVPELTWESKTPTIATVDSNGKVTAVAPGTAEIVATATTDPELTISTTFTVNKVLDSETQKVVAQIAALPDEVSLSDKQAIEEARAAYDALSDAQKELIADSEEKLKAAEAKLAKLEADQAAADEVKALIDALPTVITTAEQEKIEAARAAYDALTDDQKALLSDVKLTVAEAALAAAEEKETSDKEAADAFKALVNALPATVTLNDKEQVAAARTAYDALTDDQKAFVTKELEKLVAAEAAIVALENQAAADEVKALIDALPTTITTADKDKVEAARTAYDALTDDQKALIPEELEKLIAAEAALKTKSDQAAADEVKALIDALPSTITTANKNQIEAARAAYDALTDDQKALIPTELEKLTAAEAALATAPDREKAESVVKQINALPATITLENKEAVVAARTAYDALTDVQKALVSEETKAKLTNAETAINKAEDQVAADEVKALINALPTTIKTSDKAHITAARTAHDALTDAQKALIPEELEKLIIAETALKDAEDQAAANEVKALIDALPATITTADKTQIEAARAAYNALTDAQKALLSDEKLIAAETALATAEKEAAADKALADAMKVLIDALPATTTLDDKAKVEAARAAYDTLTEKQKALIPEETTTKLTNAEAALKSLLDQVTADNVKALIDALPATITTADKAQIEAARAAYNALTDAQKALVPEDEKTKLINAEAAIQEAEKAKADKEAADAVEAVIDALPADIATSDKEQIEAAKKAYNALTADQKKLVPEDKVAKLNKAVKDIKTLEDEKVVEEFTKAVDAIKNAKAGEGKGKLTVANAIYDTLTDDQKTLVSEETMSTYNDAIYAFTEGIVFRSGDAYYKVLPSGNVTYNKPVDKEHITSCFVPAQVKKYGFLYKVVKVSINAYKDCPNLEWVVVHKNIGNIGKYAFKNTPKLKTIKILTTSLKSGKVTNTFVGAGVGKGTGLTVKVPNRYVKTYNSLFKGEGGLNAKAKIQAAS